MEEQILERVLFHAGKTLITAGDAGSDSFIIQSGEVVAFTVIDNDKIEVARYGANSIISESNLLLDSKSDLTYQAITDTTAVKITRQDFKKKMNRVDKSVQRVITGVLNKVREQEKEEIERALRVKKVDHKAKEIVNYLLRDMPDERRNRYEDILLPHFNIMIKSIDDLRTQEKHEKQKENLEKKVNEIKQGTVAASPTEQPPPNADGQAYEIVENTKN